METVLENTGVCVPDWPIEVDFGEWIINHPDCDAIYERISGSSNILIYAYAMTRSGNDALRVLRDQQFSGKKILQGVSERGIRQLV